MYNTKEKVMQWLEEFPLLNLIYKLTPSWVSLYNVWVVRVFIVEEAKSDWVINTFAFHSFWSNSQLLSTTPGCQSYHQDSMGENLTKSKLPNTYASKM